MARDLTADRAISSLVNTEYRGIKNKVKEIINLN